MQKFSELMKGNELIVAPVALNPIMARLAEEAGFKAIYLSGGSLGWLKCVTEANLTLPELAAVALDLVAVLQSGAYGLTASPTGFLSHPMPAELLVDGGVATVIRPSE